MADNQKRITDEVERGVGYFAAMKNAAAFMQTETLKEQQMLNRKYGNVYASSQEQAGLEESPDMLPMVRPGDASMAAPFTTRAPSIRAVVDLIRQGRCTLLSALQQQQIMMLQSIISA